LKNPFFTLNISFAPGSWSKTSLLLPLLTITYWTLKDNLHGYQFAEIIGNLTRDDWNWNEEVERIKQDT
jgi:hypothetical protein